MSAEAQLQDMLKPMECTITPIKLDYCRLIAVHRCAATEEEESNCTKYSPNPAGRCANALTQYGIKTCIIGGTDGR